MRGSPWSVRLPGLLQVVVVCAFCSPALADVYEPDVDKVVTLFEKDDGQGNSTEIYWHQKDLEEDWASVTQKGIWIYYSEANYKGANVTAVIGEDLSINIRHPLRSVRYVGNSRFNTLPAVVLYSEPWFRGTEYAVEVRRPLKHLVSLLRFAVDGDIVTSRTAMNADLARVLRCPNADVTACV
ncbi:uncharacterized protein LOC122262085 [Penaeus japonicus]|uniref:uncharacterized protein LOC122262085 n=1 Tax=Penaeus japonicus TaxID=27405 RepID=UPI001C71580E|nr:uncharacterized protein LOC122262085 [Penaeus japonicus]